MSGFLDKNTRVVDMVLTDYGRELYSKGNLKFEYYAFSDDEVDYDPYISTSGSVTDVRLLELKDEQIEATLVREACFGLIGATDSLAEDNLNIRNHLFTVPQGQTTVPKMKINPDIISGSLEAKQQKIRERSIIRNQFGDVIQVIGEVDRGFRKFNSSNIKFDLDIDDFFDFATREGFLITVYSSGSDGLVEVLPKRDLSNTLSYNSDFKLLKDSEVEYEIRKAGSPKEMTSIVRKK